MRSLDTLRNGSTPCPALKRNNISLDRLMICSPITAATTASKGSVKKVIGNNSEPKLPKNCLNIIPPK